MTKQEVKMTEPEIIWQPNPGPQTDFLRSTARETLFGGSAGSSKTDGLLGYILMQVRSPNARALFIRRTMPQLRDAIARSFQLFRPLGADFSKQERIWTFPNGATCEFGFLNSPDDKYNYLGRQFTLLCFDELAQLGADSVDAEGNPNPVPICICCRGCAVLKAVVFGMR